MHVLLVGGGGREHALAWKLAQSPRLTRLSVTHQNPGFPAGCTVADGDLVEWAAGQGVDLVVVGPEAPLAEGLVDRLGERGIAACGPTRAAAQLESSKSFAKAFMDRHGIPTARWSVHDEADSAHAAIDGPCVVKADGLAAGKGVLVAPEPAAAHAAVDEIFGGRFGEAGAQVLIEELLEGPEVSVIALCDGERAVTLLPSRDHKRRFDGDQGPNTGGMGAICPTPDVSAAQLEAIVELVIRPTMAGMAAEGRPLRGVLYAGIMLTPDGPRVLEYNVRFGDPECQPLMMMLAEDLLPWLEGAARGQLPAGEPAWHEGVACCVVAVSGGYPGRYPKGLPITKLPSDRDGLVVFHAGTSRDAEGGLVTSGGRVLGITARGADLADARAEAYEAIAQVGFEGAGWRSDIGGSTLALLQAGGSPTPRESE